MVTTLFLWFVLNGVSQVCKVQTVTAENQPLEGFQMIISHDGMVFELKFSYGIMLARIYVYKEDRWLADTCVLCLLGIAPPSFEFKVFLPVYLSNQIYLTV